MAGLGTLPGRTRSTGYAVSGDASVVVGWSGSSRDEFDGEAFRWTSAGGMIGLGAAPGDALSVASGTNADGTVVVGVSGTDFHNWAPESAFRWTSAGGMVSLGTLPGGWHSTASAVSADGSVVVGWSDGYGAINAHAFRWTSAGGMEDLGTLPQGYDSGASAVSADGAVVVGTSDGRAVFWTPTLGIVDLNWYLPAFGINLTGWTLANAMGVSADGLTITGYGYHVHVNGYTYPEAWVAHLGSLCYPDCNKSGDLTVADFTCFQTRFIAGDPYADCNQSGNLTVADFTCFQTAFVAGCP